jgi:hypothetical protein
MIKILKFNKLYLVYKKRKFFIKIFLFIYCLDTIVQFSTQLQNASETFINEIRNVKHKHRNQLLCETLIERIEQSK